MSQRPSVLLQIGLAVSFGVNLLLAVLVATSRGAPQAHGQAGIQSEGFVLATEQGGNDSAVCFVLSTATDKPRLLVYKSDSQGLLRLMSARLIECDLKLKDFHLPPTKGAGSATTLPTVKDVCAAVNEAAAKEAKKEKKTEKKAGKKPGEEKEEEKDAEKEKDEEPK